MVFRSLKEWVRWLEKNDDTYRKVLDFIRRNHINPMESDNMSFFIDEDKNVSRDSPGVDLTNV